MKRVPVGLIPCIGAALCIAFTSSVMAESSAKRVFGTVQDMDGKPIGGATVVFSSSYGGRWAVVTNRKGWYDVPGLLYFSGYRHEKWTVSADASEYLPVSVEVRVLHANGNVSRAFVQNLRAAPAVSSFSIPRRGTVEVNWTLGERAFLESQIHVAIPGSVIAGNHAETQPTQSSEAALPPPIGGNIGGIPVEVAGPGDHELDKVLAYLASLARLYADGALGFTCDELISYRRSGYSRGKVKYRYIYRRLDGKLEDYRTYRKRGSGPDRADMVRYPGPVILRRPYSWVFSFEASRQPMNTYRILGTGEVLGRPAIKLWVQPTGPDAVVPEANDWVGEYWIDRETFQLLRVDAMGLDEYRKQRRLEAAFDRARSSASSKDIGRGEYSIERITTLFAVVEKGVRYPSQVVIERRRYQVPTDDSMDDGEREYRVQQSYSNYRFYSTSATVTLEQIVGGR